MSHKTGCKQRIEETLKKTQLNKAVTWIIGEVFFVLFCFYTSVFKNTLAQTFFQSSLMSCLTGKHLCISSFLD